MNKLWHARPRSIADVGLVLHAVHPCNPLVQGIEGIDYILHEGLMLLLFLLLYYYLHNCEPAIGGEANLADSFISTPHETPLRPQILQNISHTNYGATSPEDLAGGYTSSRPRADDQQTPRLRNTSTPSSIPGSIPAVGSPFRIPTSQVRWESEPSINCETDVSGTAWDVSALQDLAHWCQAKSFPILLSLLLVRPTPPSYPDPPVPSSCRTLKLAVCFWQICKRLVFWRDRSNTTPLRVREMGPQDRRQKLGFVFVCPPRALTGQKHTPRVRLANGKMCRLTLVLLK